MCTERQMYSLTFWDIVYQQLITDGHTIIHVPADVCFLRPIPRLLMSVMWRLDHQRLHTYASLSAFYNADYPEHTIDNQQSLICLVIFPAKTSNWSVDLAIQRRAISSLWRQWLPFWWSVLNQAPNVIFCSSKMPISSNILWKILNFAIFCYSQYEDFYCNIFA